MCIVDKFTYFGLCFVIDAYSSICALQGARVLWISYLIACFRANRCEYSNLLLEEFAVSVQTCLK
jgi:hypothetical protein